MVLFKHYRVSSDVLTLLSDALKKFEKSNKNSFHQYTHNENVSNHKYAEGYFHCNYGVTSLSVDPRSLSCNIEKDAAPVELCAFVQTFKELNKDVLREIIANTQLEKLNLLGNLFCDVSYQIHSMHGIGKNDVMWHNDGHNSMLHLGMSICNKRLLYYMKNNKQQQCWQRPGSIYLATPNIMSHGVQYPSTTAQNPIVSLQCRIELTHKQLSILNEHHEQTVQDTKKISLAAQKTIFIIPSKDDIIKCMNTLKNRQHDKSVVDNDKTHRCKHCGMYFKSRALLFEHKKSHAVEKPWSCLKCHRKFFKKRLWQVHCRKCN